MERASPMPCATFRRCSVRYPTLSTHQEISMYPNLPETLLETLPVPALALDDQGNILHFNEAARRLLPASTQIGSRIDSALPESAVLLTLMTQHPEGFQC